MILLPKYNADLTNRTKKLKLKFQRHFSKFWVNQSKNEAKKCLLFHHNQLSAFFNICILRKSIMTHFDFSQNVSFSQLIKNKLKLTYQIIRKLHQKKPLHSPTVFREDNFCKTRNLFETCFSAKIFVQQKNSIFDYQPKMYSANLLSFGEFIPRKFCRFVQWTSFHIHFSSFDQRNSQLTGKNWLQKAKLNCTQRVLAKLQAIFVLLSFCLLMIQFVKKSF